MEAACCSSRGRDVDGWEVEGKEIFCCSAGGRDGGGWEDEGWREVSGSSEDSVDRSSGMGNATRVAAQAHVSDGHGC
jgi:hypothetical protein